jgi:hypothetical protein
MVCSADNERSSSSGPINQYDKTLIPGSLVLLDSNRNPHHHNTTLFIDNGCSGMALLSEDFANKLKIKTCPSEHPIPVILADGSRSKSIIRKSEPLTLRVANHTEEIVFLICKMPFEVILGLQWIRLHNPSIDWKKMSFHLNDNSCFSAGHCTVSSTVDCIPNPPVDHEYPEPLLSNSSIIGVESRNQEPLSRKNPESSKNPVSRNNPESSKNLVSRNNQVSRNIQESRNQESSKNPESRNQESRICRQNWFDL